MKDGSLSWLLKDNAVFSSPLKIGDLVEGILIEKAAKRAYFDLNKFGTGIVYGAEFLNASNLIKNLNIGEKITAKVIDLENDEGYIELSLSEADKQKGWQVIKELQEKNEVLTVKINGANTGGLTTQINDLPAFLPVSQLTSEHYPRVTEGDKSKILEELKKLVNQELKVKIIDINPRANKLIISEKEAVEEDIKSMLNKYKVGDVVPGIISGVADFGAFFRFSDNPKIEGLVHISELDHKLIEHPKEVVKVDDVVTAKILEIKDGRVTLSLKALKADPWEKIEEQYKAGQELSGTVGRFNPFGAFINLSPAIQGLIHVSEFGSLEEMKKQIEIGKEYKFKIETIKPQERRIILKLKK
jgi:small subunit ribosomal protein S1